VRDNTGSIARDHLANERTFLAWVRTALAVIGLGVLLGTLVETEGPRAEIIGLAMVGFGAAMLLYSMVRFEQVTTLLNAGKLLRPGGDRLPSPSSVWWSLLGR